MKQANNFATFEHARWEVRADQARDESGARTGGHRRNKRSWRQLLLRPKWLFTEACSSLIFFRACSYSKPFSRVMDNVFVFSRIIWECSIVLVARGLFSGRSSLNFECGKVLPPCNFLLLLSLWSFSTDATAVLFSWRFYFLRSSASQFLTTFFRHIFVLPMHFSVVILMYPEIILLVIVP